MREVLAAAGDVEIVGIGVDGQMHGLVLTDATGAPLRPAMIWADSRASAQAALWRGLPPTTRAALGNPISPGMAGPMLAWLGEHEPATVERAAWVLSPKDWLRMRLTGRAATDPSDASATLLWDVSADTWATDLLAALALPVRLLPPVLGSGHLAGPLLNSAADALGLPAGLPVAVGAADTAAALLASAVAPGETLVTVGSGAQVIQLTTKPQPVPDPVTHLLRAAEPERWYAMGAVQNAGLALNWVREVFAVSWEELYASLTASPAGPAPIFVPYLTGERTPILNSAVRGAWLGLNLGHGRADLLRAAVSGVAFAVRHAYDSLTGPRSPAVLLAGGGTRHPAMRQLLADVLAVPVVPLRMANASPTGAALLAGMAAGRPVRHAQPEREAPVTPRSGEVTRRQREYEAYLSAAQALSARTATGHD